MMRPILRTDLEELSRWYMARGQKPLRGDVLPQCGVLVPELAAGFLYQTDAPGLVMLDGYVTNPDALLVRRTEALKEITSSLLASAKLIGATYVMALCKSRGIERLAKRYGLERVGVYALAGKEL